MTTALVLWLGRRMLHARTLELVMEPALADLAHERRSGSSHRFSVDQCRLVVGTLAALTRGLWHDLVWDERRPPWHPPAPALVTTVVLLVSYHLFMSVVMLGVGSRWSPMHAIGLDTPSQQDFVAAMALVFGSGVAWVARRTHNARSH